MNFNSYRGILVDLLNKEGLNGEDVVNGQDDRIYFANIMIVDPKILAKRMASEVRENKPKPKGDIIMSHSFIGVILPEGYSDEKEIVTTLLEPYDENKQMLPYKKYLDDQVIESMAKHYKVDPENTSTLVDLIEGWEGSKGGYDDTGFFYWCTYNPNSKWDWYVIGGRWTGIIKENMTSVKDLIKSPPPHDNHYFFAIVTPDGKWYESGNMGWFGISIDNKDNWKEKELNILKQYPDNMIVGVDVHI